MEHQVVAVKDRALDTFMRPFFTPALGAAIRSFQDEINRTESEMNKHPDDYDLYHLGHWDDASGAFQSFQQPIQIGIGKQLTNTAK